LSRFFTFDHVRWCWVKNSRSGRLRAAEPKNMPSKLKSKGNFNADTGVHAREVTFNSISRWRSGIIITLLYLLQSEPRRAYVCGRSAHQQLRLNHLLEHGDQERKQSTSHRSAHPQYHRITVTRSISAIGSIIRGAEDAPSEAGGGGRGGRGTTLYTLASGTTSRTIA
jgi:hypothetical protein